MFQRASENSEEELKNRQTMFKSAGRLGIEFLDDALGGIYPDDLILIGAPSGAGKTALCCNIAVSNLEDGKKVHYIALEASMYEIERRIKYPHVMERFYSDPKKPIIKGGVSYSDWLTNKYEKELSDYEKCASDFFKKGYTDLHIYYRQDKFGIEELIETVLYCAESTDLIIIDHVHYFDYDDQNENRAIKEIAKTVRDLAIRQQKPIILVSHLRKKDKNSEDLAAGLEEFHGSSDLYKIATKVVTIAPGGVTSDGLYETFFRIPKNRIDGSVTRFIGRELFNPRINGYEKKRYQLGFSFLSKKTGFKPINQDQIPGWARRCDKSCYSPTIPKRGYNWSDEN